MKALDHENTVKLLEVTDTEETFFLEMEGLSEGARAAIWRTMGHDRADTQGPLRQLVSALQLGLQRHVLHWDLKPGNLLFDTK